METCGPTTGLLGCLLGGVWQGIVGLRVGVAYAVQWFGVLWFSWFYAYFVMQLLRLCLIHLLFLLLRQQSLQVR